MIELILKKYMENAQAESNPTKSISDDNIELSKEFLIELKNKAYHGMFDEDVVDHIAKILELLDLIKIPGVDSHRLRMKVFPLSLADDARQWWVNEEEGKIITWEELVEKFFCKFYPESHDGEDEMLDKGHNWGIDPLEFISRMNGQQYFEQQWKESDYRNPLNTTTDSFFKAHDECNIKEGNELRQMKRKRDNKNDEQPLKGYYDHEDGEIAPSFIVLSKVVDIATCLVKVCKVWDDWEVDCYGNANSVIMEYLVKISKKARILELKRRNIKKSDSDIQYASDSSHSSMPGEGVNIDDFLSGNFRNDSQSSDDTFAAHNEKGTQNLRRSSRHNVFPRYYDDFVIDSKVKYGLEKYVNYSKLDAKNLCFVTQLNKNNKPKTSFEASKYSHWANAMNNEIDALLRNDTWKITELPKDRKAIGLCSWGKGTDYYTWVDAAGIKFCLVRGVSDTFDQLFHVEETNPRECKKTVECVACLLGRWNRSRGTDWMTSMQAALIWFVWRVKENGRSGWLCFLDRWKSALGTSLSEDVRGCDVMITVEESHGIALIGGETTQREHYGGRSSNRVASDVAEEEVMDPGKVEMVMNMSNEMPCYMLPVKINKSKGVELVTLDVAWEEVVGPGGVKMVMNECYELDRGPWKKLGSRSSRLRW
ncbi:hypothetical protein Tco_0007280 [Tanacetum coccineum]